METETTNMETGTAENTQNTSQVTVEEVFEDEESELARPLSFQEAQAARQVRESYDDFWSNMKFKRGWERPIVDKSKVGPLLDEVAQIVVRVRSFLDKKNPAVKLRMRDGSAREYLWGIQHGQVSLNISEEKARDEFIRQMVHHTFSDANGYVEGLSEKTIDRYISICEKYLKEYGLDQMKTEKLRTAWKDVEDMMRTILNINFNLKSLNEDSFQRIVTHLEEIRAEGANIIKKNEKEAQVAKDEAAKVEAAKAEAAAKAPEKKAETSSTAMEVDSEPKVDLARTGSSDDLDEEERKMMDEIIKAQEQAAEQKPETPSDSKMEEAAPAESTSSDTESKPASEPKVEENKSSAEVTNIQELPATQTVEASVSVDDHPKVQEPSTPSVDSKDKKKGGLRDSGVIKIQVIANEVEGIKSQIKDLQATADSLQIEDLETNVSQGKRTVEQLQKKCLTYIEGLMKDLLHLDSISGSTEIRPLRKAQVSIIQSMIDEVDTISKRLRGYSERLSEKEDFEEKERMEREEEERRKEEERMLEENKKQQEEMKKRQEEAQKRQEELRAQQKQQAELERSQDESEIDWKLLKLNPKFEISNGRDSIILASYIPGMNDDDVNIQLGKNRKTLTIEGVREPSADEEEALRKQVHSRYRGYQIDPSMERQLMMKAGSGRYGKFSETYQLSEDVDVDHISANYEGGVLKITIPKVERTRYTLPSSSYGRPRRAGYPSSFLNDRDFWW